MTKIREQAYACAKEIIEKAGLTKGNILVVGCSTSEVIGESIGTNSSPETAAHIYIGVKQAADEKGVYVAAQCCEHLNRAIVVSRKAVPFNSVVNVVPQPKAGGSFATTAWKNFVSPVAVEEICAQAGLDVGGTLIGMHLRRVAVPVRLQQKCIGEATLLAARTRPKYIGGIRAKYE